MAPADTGDSVPSIPTSREPHRHLLGVQGGHQRSQKPVPRIRFHDLRHQAIAELAESKTSDQTIMDIAGRVAKKMLRRYSQIRMEARRNALDALSIKTRTAG